MEEFIGTLLAWIIPKKNSSKLSKVVFCVLLLVIFLVMFGLIIKFNLSR